STKSFSGSSSLKINDTQNNANVGMQSSYIEVTPNLNYSVTAYVNAAAANLSQLQLRFYDAANTYLNSVVPTVMYDHNSPLNEWQQISVNSIAPATAAKAAIVVVSGRSPRGIVYWDDIKLEEMRLEPVMVNPAP